MTSPAPAANIVTITGADQFDPNLGNNTANSGVDPLAADLNLVKTVNDPAPNVGDTVTFTLTLTNQGPDEATGVVVSDPLPAGLTFVSATPSQGDYDPATGIWTVGTLAAGATATLLIAVRVDSPTGGTNVAVASSGTFDPDPTDNTATVDVIPALADLAVTKTVDDSTPNVGRRGHVHDPGHQPRAERRHRRRRPGPAPGRRGVRSTPRPARATFDAATGLWTVGDLANGATAQLADPGHRHRPDGRDQRRPP